MPTCDIVVTNQFATIQSRLAILLGLRGEEIRRELQYGWEHSIRTEWLIDFIHARALNAMGESYQRDACHGFLLLIFGTILFSYSSNLIDGHLPKSSSKWLKTVLSGEQYPHTAVCSRARPPAARPAARQRALPARLTSSRTPILAERAAFAPEHSSKRSSESPDSRTLSRLFPRISRLDKTFST
ncbi:hypothetical protein CRG98_021776 [Punica granatum]|uniref:Uncharacterized protein n=1 Tax=Punica granatum TaxID=22663 RepID=A0A2I0JPL1_PUNGR|nr:hypothetical protein CRG98_021776 [Punica granatum]